MSKITCEVCGALTHSIALHLKSDHPEMSVAEYTELYPNAPLLSELAQEQIRNKKAAVMMAGGAATATVLKHTFGAEHKRPMHEVFELGTVRAAMSAKGDPIQITVMSESHSHAEFVPEVDSRYIFPIDLLKNVLMGLEMNIPVYLWGHAGVGKSTMYEQVCAHTKRPYIRVQHTANTEESHIIGQVLANESGTYFEPGPLAIAMKYGLVYNADEYDFAHASVTAVYQPVLEGKSLVIKEAPSEWRIIKPHKDFRFVATGNTNGSGDETGLYAGTNLGNAANYSRFGITDHVDYMPKKLEQDVVASQAGITKKDARLIVEFADNIRKAFKSGEMTATIGPRELIYAAKIGLARMSWKHGICLAFVNRLSPIDMEVASGIMSRIFADGASFDEL